MTRGPSSPARRRSREGELPDTRILTSDLPAYPSRDRNDLGAANHGGDTPGGRIAAVLVDLLIAAVAAVVAGALWLLVLLTIPGLAITFWPAAQAWLTSARGADSLQYGLTAGTVPLVALVLVTVLIYRQRRRRGGWIS